MNAALKQWLVLGLLALNFGLAQQASVNKFFNPTSINPGDTTQLTIRIFNSSNTALTNLAVADDLGAANIRALMPLTVLSNTCGVVGSVTADNLGTGGGAGSRLRLTGGSLAAAGAVPSSCQFTVNVTSTVSGNRVNNIPASALTNTQNLTNPDPAEATLNVADQNRITVSKSSSTSVPLGGRAPFTITINNANPYNQPGLAFTDTLPAGLSLTNGPSGSPLQSNTCGGTLTDPANGSIAAGDNGIKLAGGTVPASGSCDITFWVTGASATSYTNTLAAGSVTTSRGNSNETATSATLDFVNTVQVFKGFDPTVTYNDGNSTVNITLSNPNTSAATAVNFTDALPPGITIASPNGLVNGCAGTATATSGSSSIVLAGGTIPARPASGSSATGFGTCTISVQVKASVTPNPAPGAPVTLTNTIPQNDVSTSVGPNSNTASANLQVSHNPTSGGSPKAIVDTDVGFGTSDGTDATVVIGSTTTMYVRLTNGFFNQSVSNVALNIPLPPNARIADIPNAQVIGGAPGCSGTVVAAPEATSLSWSGFSVPQRNFEGCYLKVDIVGTVLGSENNRISASTLTSTEGATNNGGNLGGNLTVISPAAVAKRFEPAMIQLGGKSRLVITLTNQAVVNLTKVALTDTLPSGMIVATPANLVNTCLGIATAAAGSTSIVLSNGTIPGQQDGVAGLCSVSVDVTNTASVTGDATLTNEIPAGALTSEQGVSNTLPASANLTVQAITLVLVKEFLTVQIGGSDPTTSRMRITLRNTSSLAATNIKFTDTMPTGMILASAPDPATTCAGGVVTGTPGAGSFSFAGGNLNPGQECVVEIFVTAVAGTNLINTIPAGGATSENGARNPDPASATLTRLPAASITKGFTPSTIGMGNTALLTISVLNGTSAAINGVRILDVLPSGLTLANPPSASTNCASGTVTATAGGSDLLLAGANLPANSACTVTARVTAGATGSYVNTILPANVSATDGTLNLSEATDTLTVTAPPTVAKAFSPGSIPSGGRSRLTLTLTNPTGTALTNAAISDAMPLGVRIANDPQAATTCGSGTVTAVEGSTSVALSAGTIPASGSCTVLVYVTAETSGTYTNTVPAGALTTDGGNSVAPTSADLVVLNPPTVEKAFSPDFLPNTSGTSRLTITVRNSNAVALTGLSITDVFPAGLSLAAVPNPATTCGGSVDTSAAGLVKLTGGTIPASLSCTVAVDVRASANGNYLNRIGLGNVSTTNGGSNRVEATAPLDVGAPSITGVVYMDPNRNNSRDTGEAGLPGVTLQLLDGSGNPVLDGSGQPITATSRPDGSYRFAGPQVVAGSNYQVREVQPLAYGSTQNSSNLISISNLPASGSRNNNFGEVLASVSGRVFRDDANNGTFEGTDIGLVTPLTLSGLSYGPDGVAGGGDDSLVNVLGQSNPDGTYSFGGLFPGSYTVTETQPTGYVNGITTAGSTGGNPSAVLTTPSTISNIPLGAGQQSLNNNFAEIVLGSIGARVWRDTDNDGVIDAGEAAIQGATVRLRGTNDLGQSVDTTLLTNASGNVVFGNLRPGTYQLTETTPTGFLDGKDRNGTPAGTLANDDITNIVLGSGINATGYAFGEIQPSGLSGTVYRDLNNGGTQGGATETGISGVTVTLTGNDELGNAVCYRAITNSAGLYSFTPGSTVVDCTNPTSPVTINSFVGLRPSDASGYTLTETQPAGFGSAIANAPGTVNGTPSGTASTLNTFTGVRITNSGSTGLNYNFGELPQLGVSGAVYVDKDRNANFGPGDTPLPSISIRLQGSDTDGNPVDLTVQTLADGSYNFPTVKPGTYTITETQPSGYANGLEATTNVRNIGVSDFVAGSVTGQNFGENIGSIAGKVYRDLNNDGTQAGATETGIVGVTITLSGTDLNNNPVSRTTQTGPDGSYRFDDVFPPNATGYTLTETQPSGFSDAKPNTPGDAAGSAGGSNTYTGVAPTLGQQAVNYNFGELPTGTLSGSIWMDANGNTTRDALEGPLPAAVGPITVRVTGTDLNGNPITREVQTDGAGNYSFPDLPPGTYTLTVVNPPASYRLTTANATQPIALAVGETKTAAPIGYQPMGTVSGHVYRDDNGNGIQDPGEPVYANTPVVITDAFGATQTVQTDANGNYTATVPAGPTTANVTDPDNTRLTTANDPQQVVAVVGVNTPTTPVGFQPLEGDLFGRVFEDKNGNGQYDTGEGFANVTVRITDPFKKNPDGSALVHEVKTDSQGRYDTRTPDPSDPSKPPVKVSVGNATIQVVDSTLPPTPAGENGWVQTVGTNPSTVTVQPATSTNAGDDGYVRPRLSIAKTALQSETTVGGIVNWRIRVSNAGVVAVREVEIVDTLPLGLTYKTGSSKLNDAAMPDPTITVVNNRQRLSWKLSAALAPTQQAVIELGTLVGPQTGSLQNTAQASAVAGTGNATTAANTAVAAALVTVKQGVFTDKIVLVGRVYLDKNDNNSYEEGTDQGLAGARVYLSDGRYAVTDAKGRYSLPEVETELYALRLDPLTVPYLPKPVPDDQGMPGSRYGRIPVGGGIVNEDFPLYPLEGTAVKVRSTTVRRGPVRLEKGVVQGGSGYAITIGLNLSQSVSGLNLTDPVPANAQRGEVSLVDASGRALSVRVEGNRLILPAELAAGSYTLRYALTTNLPPDQVLTDPDINWEVKR